MSVQDKEHSMKYIVTVRILVISFVLSLLCTPKVSAAGGQTSTLTYSQRHAIWEVTPQNKSRLLIPANATDLQWSSEGTYVAFKNTASDTLEMSSRYGRQIITNAPCKTDGVAWAPNDTQLAFTCERILNGRAQHAIVVFNAKTTRQVAVTSWSSTTVYRSPSWSPDSQNIVYEASASGHAQLFTLNLRNRVAHPLVSLSDTTPHRNVSWSPNGKKILYNDSVNELYTIWPDGTHRSTLADGESYDGSWSPDGTRIVFIEDPADDTLSLSESDGSISYIHLNTPGGTKAKPQWSPDGSHIAFTLDGIRGGLFSTDISGTKTIKHRNGPIDSFAWKP